MQIGMGGGEGGDDRGAAVPAPQRFGSQCKVCNLLQREAHGAGDTIVSSSLTLGCHTTGVP